jgi:hypothetical protein
MNDLIGVLFFGLVAAGAYFGLRAIAAPVRKTESEFERNAAGSTSMLGASMNALQELLNPEAAKAKEVEMQLKEGRYRKKKREGKSGGSLGTGGEKHEAEQIQ